MEQFWDEIDSEEVHVRDKLQFELKSEFLPHLNVKKNRYIQEFFFFVPNSLQINHLTYSKIQFYEDQTNLIRYKTPEFSFADLLDTHNKRSPLTRISETCDLPNTEENQSILEDELKLLANIVRSSLRNETKKLIYDLDQLDASESAKKLIKNVTDLFHQLRELKDRLRKLKEKCITQWRSLIFEKYFFYAEEFISNSVSHYFTGLLEALRHKPRPELIEIDHMICNLLVEEQHHQDKECLETLANGTEKIDNELILYRRSLLDKFVLDALLLNTNRISVDVKFQSWIGGIAAGIAMLIYILFFIWLGTVFLINSQPFLLLTVIIYVLKDRIKDEVKALSYHHAFKWFSDYRTEIRSPDSKQTLGILSESFSFIDEGAIPEEIRLKRNREFHIVLEEFQRPERVIYYKKTILIKKPIKGRQGRRHGLNIIFRFNIHRFLLKASNPYEVYTTIDPKTLKLINLSLPKVYHLNLIMKSTSFTEEGNPLVEFKKFRLIIDKKGIKRIEQVTSL